MGSVHGPRTARWDHEPESRKTLEINGLTLRFMERCGIHGIGLRNEAMGVVSGESHVLGGAPVDPNPRSLEP